MAARVRHAPGYHEWPSSTPILDAIITVMAVASIVIGGYAMLFVALAALDGNAELAVKNGLFLVAIALANGFVDVLRQWRRHHG